MQVAMQGEKPNVWHESKCDDPEYFSKYREANREAYNSYHVEYYAKNAERLKAYHLKRYHLTKTRIVCECGTGVNTVSLKHHYKSKTHELWAAAQETRAKNEAEPSVI